MDFYLSFLSGCVVTGLTGYMYNKFTSNKYKKIEVQNDSEHYFLKHCGEEVLYFKFYKLEHNFELFFSKSDEGDEFVETILKEGNKYEYYQDYLERNSDFFNENFNRIKCSGCNVPVTFTSSLDYGRDKVLGFSLDNTISLEILPFSFEHLIDYNKIKNDIRNLV
jgi:hypothetical protein